MEAVIDPINYKDHCLLKYQNQDVFSLITRKMLIHKQLERPPRTYVVYSDLHGSYEKFIHWLKNGMGYTKMAVRENLGQAYQAPILECYEKLLFLINRDQIEKIQLEIESEENNKIENHATPKSDQFMAPVSSKFIGVLEQLESFSLGRSRVLNDLLGLLRGITRGDERRIIKVIPQDFLENFLILYQGGPSECFNAMVDAICKDEDLFQIMASLFVKVINVNLIEKHINLGDTFDRGDGADKLIKFFKKYFDEKRGSPPLHYLWGNHDILWMGAAIGNPALVMTALRISLRYGNTKFLERYGLDLLELEKFAKKCYHLPPTGKYTKEEINSENDLVAKVTKVLFVLEIKLTLSSLKNVILEIENKLKEDGEDRKRYTHEKIEAKAGMVSSNIMYLKAYREEYNRYRDLLDLFPKNVGEDKKEWDKNKEHNPLFLDCYFPTMDSEIPEKLTTYEEKLVGNLVDQFSKSLRLQEDIQWLYEKGEAYRVVDTTLYFHAAIPSTLDKKLANQDGPGPFGKSLMDHVQYKLKQIGIRHFSGMKVSLSDKMFLWHLWAGKESIFFCKSKMATIERTIFNKELAGGNPLTTHQEIPNPFYKNVRDEEFLKNLLEEFHAEKICVGHTPVKTLQQAVLGKKISAFVIDGGASPAYGDKGAVLINTPDFIYLTMHPPLKELKRAEDEYRLPEFITYTIEEKNRFKLRHMEKGHFLKAELEAIEQILKQKMGPFKNKYFSLNKAPDLDSTCCVSSSKEIFGPQGKPTPDQLEI